jgi:hypothetical protein
MKTVKRFRVVAMIFSLPLVALTFLPGVKADQWNKKTFVTFSAPVEVAVAQVVEAPPVETAAATAEPMPKTASDMPLLALIGLLSVGAGVMLTLTLKRIV